jgi:uncharacterized protein (DUF697 family)
MKYDIKLFEIREKHLHEIIRDSYFKIRDNYVFSLIHSASALSFVAAEASAQLPFSGRAIMSQIQCSLIVSVAFKFGFVLTPNAALAGIVEILATISTDMFVDSTTAHVNQNAVIIYLLENIMDEIDLEIGNVLKGASAAMTTNSIGCTAYSMMKDKAMMPKWETKAKETSNNFANETMALSQLLTDLSEGTTRIDRVMEYCFGKTFAMNSITYLQHYYSFLLNEKIKWII